jgi:hypothetical protein
MARRKPDAWQKEVETAERALDANKKRLDSVDATGLGSDKTLSRRGYDPDPKGGGAHLALEVARHQAGSREPA